jgi:cellobiose transport system substrate-binding protein
VKLSRRTKVAAAVAGAASFALLAAGCSSSGGDAGTSSNPITLTVTTFGTMGFDKLYSQYEKEHPGIKIKATNIDTGDNALTDWQTKEAAGSGLPDVQAVEEGWLSKVMQVSDQFNDLKDYGANDIKSRWVDWKLKQAPEPRAAPRGVRRAQGREAARAPVLRRRLAPPLPARGDR